MFFLRCHIVFAGFRFKNTNKRETIQVLGAIYIFNQINRFSKILQNEQKTHTHTYTHTHIYIWRHLFNNIADIPVYHILLRRQSIFFFTRILVVIKKKRWSLMKNQNHSCLRVIKHLTQKKDQVRLLIMKFYTKHDFLFICYTFVCDISTRKMFFIQI